MKTAMLEQEAGAGGGHLQGVMESGAGETAGRLFQLVDLYRSPAGRGMVLELLGETRRLENAWAGQKARVFLLKVITALGKYLATHRCAGDSAEWNLFRRTASVLQAGLDSRENQGRMVVAAKVIFREYNELRLAHQRMAQEGSASVPQVQDGASADTGRLASASRASHEVLARLDDFFGADDGGAAGPVQGMPDVVAYVAPPVSPRPRPVRQAENVGHPETLARPFDLIAVLSTPKESGENDGLLLEMHLDSVKRVIEGRSELAPESGRSLPESETGSERPCPVSDCAPQASTLLEAARETRPEKLVARIRQLRRQGGMSVSGRMCLDLLYSLAIQRLRKGTSRGIEKWINDLIGLFQECREGVAPAGDPMERVARAMRQVLLLLAANARGPRRATAPKA